MKKRLNILLYHRVLDKFDPLRPSEPDIKRFNKQMKWIKRFYNVLDLADAVSKLLMDQLPPRALCITFDDGYKDNYQNALPILEKHELTATFFVATGFLNGGIMWNDTVVESLRNTKQKNLDLRGYGIGCYDICEDRTECLGKIINDLKYLSFHDRARVVTDLPDILKVPAPVGLMMTEKDVNVLHRRSMGIGGHTVNHPILSRLSTQQARQELENGKQTLEQIIGERVALFAYPNGKPGNDYQQEHADMVKQAGFDAAVSTVWGVAAKESDLYQLPRFTPWDQNIAKFIFRLEKMRRTGAGQKSQERINSAQ